MEDWQYERLEERSDILYYIEGKMLALQEEINSCHSTLAAISLKDCYSMLKSLYEEIKEECHLE